VTAYYAGKARACTGWHKKLDVYRMIGLTDGLGELKMHRYGALLRSMLEDQLAWIADRKHVRKIAEENGRDSLVMAWAADELAHAEMS